MTTKYYKLKKAIFHKIFNMLSRFLLLLCMIRFYDVSAQVLIKNVNVLDVEKKKVLEGYNVVALDGKIVSVDKGRMYKLPEGTLVIDGTGKYLIPGLVDAHVHFFQSGGLFARPDGIDLRKYQPYEQEIKWVHDHMDDFLRLYTQVGITSVIDVGSTFNFLRQRDTMVNKLYSPVISMTGPLLTTWIPEVYKNLGNDSPFDQMQTEDGVRESVRRQMGQKADFIKIWYIVLDSNKERGAMKNLPLVKAAIDEAHQNNLRVAVHATERITAQLAVEAGADFLVHNIEDEIISPAFVRLLKSKKTVVCPTMIVGPNYSHTFGDKFPFTTDELITSHPTTLSSIINYPFPDTVIGKRYMQMMNSERTVSRNAKTDSISRENLKSLLAGGVVIATGTDAGNIGTQHVGSYFKELAAMQQAGFTQWQLLEASTINGAKAMGKENQYGSIARDKMANMVLLTDNPLNDLASWRKVEYVINKGVAFKPDSFINRSPEMLAQEQLNGYNAHDLEAFLAPYADDVVGYDLPDKIAFKGKEEMRKIYQFVQQMPNMYCRLLNRMVQGNTVIDHEEILGVPGSPHYGIAIYTIEKGKIKTVHFTK